jgi:hypothetical protein
VPAEPPTAHSASLPRPMATPEPLSTTYGSIRDPGRQRQKLT